MLTDYFSNVKMELVLIRHHNVILRLMDAHIIQMSNVQMEVV